MNRVLRTAAFFLMTSIVMPGATSANAQVAPVFATEPKQVPVLFDKMYSPGGFDSNDHVQLVGEGLFAHTCYRHAETTVRVDSGAKKIHLGPVAYKYQGLCLQMILPFERIIDVGVLQAGSWEIVQGPKQEKIGDLKVATATKPEADDYLYAPVSQVSFRQNGATSEVSVSGTFRNSCLTIEDVKVTLEPTVIVLQPVAKMNANIDARSDCKDGLYPFSETKFLPLMTAGRYLLHVRSMGGNALNSIVELK